MFLKKSAVFCSVVLIVLSTVTAQQKFYTIPEFKTVSGETINNCKIGYRTFGKLNSDSGNVIIYPTWFAGTSESVKSLIGEDKFIDSAKYFAIVIDALGNGISSSPSNYEAGNFPDITIADMVKSQYELLTKGFGFKNIYGAIGGSMGGMQVFEWVAQYPDFINRAVTYVGTPRPTAYDLLVWNSRLNVIETGKQLHESEKQIQKSLNMIMTLLLRTPDYIAENVNPDEFDKYYAKFDGEPNTIFTTDNYRSQLKAMINHNIYKRYNNSIEQTIASVKTKLFIISSKTDHLVHPQNTIEFAKKSGSRFLLMDNYCGHLAPGCEMDFIGRQIREFFDK